MAEATRKTYKMPFDEHRPHRINLMRMIDKGELFRARSGQSVYRRTTGKSVQRCNPIDDGHVQTLIDIGFVCEDTRSVSRLLDGDKDQSIRVNPLFLGGLGGEYYAKNQHVR
jgi:hypothetical protein